MKPARTDDSEPEIPPEGGHGFNMPVLITIAAAVVVAIVLGMLWT